VVGNTWVQVAPSNSHVWSTDGPPKNDVLMLPYITVTPRSGSCTSSTPVLPLGDATGASRVQVVPSNDHVSLLVENPAVPPNSTI
jgi:hypothetical protein